MALSTVTRPPYLPSVWMCASRTPSFPPWMCASRAPFLPSLDVCPPSPPPTPTLVVCFTRLPPSPLQVWGGPGLVRKGQDLEAFRLFRMERRVEAGRGAHHGWGRSGGAAIRGGKGRKMVMGGY